MLYVLKTLYILTIKHFNYAYKNEQNIHWHIGLYTFVVIIPEGGIFVPKHVGVYVCGVYCIMKYICWIVY